jgi:predicted porin
MQYGRLAIGTLLAVAAAYPALAAPAAPPPGSGRQFNVTLQGTVAYDDNEPRTSAALAAQRHLVLEDETYSPSLGLDMRVPVGREALFFNGTAGYIYHDKNTILDSERINLLGGVDARLSICQARLAGAYDRSLTSLEDIVLASTITDKLETERVGLDVNCGRRTGLGASFSASQNWGNHSALLEAVQDYRSHSYQAGVTYARPVLGVFTLFGNYQKSEFPHRPSVGGQLDGYENVSGGVTYDRRLGARIEGTVTLAYSEVTQLVVNPLFPSKDFSGATYSAALKYRATPRLSTDLLFERAIQPSNRIGSNYDLQTHYRVNGAYDLSKRLKLNIGYERKDVASSAIGLSTVNTLTNSKTNVVFGGVRYDLSRRISLALDLAQEQRKTNNPIFDYRDNHAAVTLRARY